MSFVRAFAVAIWVLAFASQSLAQECKLPKGFCGGSAQSTAGKAAKAQNPAKLFSVILPNSRTPLQKDYLYIVDAFCEQVTATDANSSWSVFKQTDVVTSHTIALTEDRLSSADFPTKAKEIIPVFSVSGARADKRIFINSECRSTFPLSGRDTLYLAVTANRTVTNTPGTLVNFIYKGIRVLNPFGSLFSNFSAVKPAVDAVQASEQPLKDLLVASNSGNTYTEPFDLYEGKTTVISPFSRVYIKIFRINSIVKQRETAYREKDKGIQRAYDEILTEFEESMNDHIAEVKKTTTDEDFEKKCSSWSVDMVNQNLNSFDISYGLAYVTRLSSLTARQSILCLGREYALESLQHNELWAKFKSNSFDNNDVKVVFGDRPAKSIQPRFEDVKEALNKLLHLLGSYIQQGNPNAETTSFDQKFAPTIAVSNSSDLLPFADRSMPIAELLQLFISKSITRVGCLTSDSAAMAEFLIFGPPTGPKNTYVRNDALVVKVWRNQDGVIGRVHIEFSVADRDRAFKENGNACGQSVLVS